MSIVTVLTPTYNRAGMLPRLYESLCAQTARDFVWLVVDDGSADDTGALVAGWQSEARLNITYLRRENGGKHRALNTGMQAVVTPLTFIVDSDDTLTPDAVAQIERIHEKYGARDNLCGYSFLKVGTDGRSFATKALTEPERVATFAQARIRENNLGDMAEVWLTDVLRRYPFPEYPGEKFYSETGVWLRMSGSMVMVFVNTPIYICEYYQDGLTKNRKKAQAGSPRGMLDSCALLMQPACGLFANLRAGLRYDVFAHRLGMSLAETLRTSGRPSIALLCYLPSIPLRKRWPK